MTTQAALLLQTYYSGTVPAKLSLARALSADQGARLLASPAIREGLEQLRRHSLALEGQMQVMDLGRLCSRCAAGAGGGCCSAFMADNVDSILLLINLLLMVTVQSSENDPASCCFLGAQGCQFQVKPIFCLNYNCRHILDRAEATSLTSLYRLAAAVLSQQTRVETLLLDALSPRHHGHAAAQPAPIEPLPYIP